jgi:M6 family metalloprotease-like protein
LAYSIAKQQYQKGNGDLMRAWRIRRLPSAVALLLAVTLLVSFGTTTLALAAPKSYKNCVELNKTYKYGVSAKAKPKNIGTEAVFTPAVNIAVFNKNKKLDIDRDSIVCEVIRKVTVPAPFVNPQSDPLTSCQYPSNSAQVTSFGFPKHPRSLPSSGQLDGLMVFVNFTDVKGTDDPLKTGPKFTKKFEDFYFAQSYGKLKISTRILPSYLQIDKDSGSYGMQNWGDGDPGGYFKDGLLVAAQIENLSKYDFVIVMPPNAIDKIAYGPSFPSWSPTDVPNLKPLYGGVVGGADQRAKEESTGWIWLSHEIGHLLGFEHQYGYYPQPIWDLMDNVYIETAPSLFGWHRFMQGWLDGNQVLCLSNPLPGQSTVVRLDKLEGQSQSVKLALFKLDETQLLGLEYRQKSQFDFLPTEAEGVLAHVIKPTLSSNQRAIDLLKTDGPRNREGQRYGVLKTGDSIDSPTHLIKVLSMDGNGATVSILRK